MRRTLALAALLAAASSSCGKSRTEVLVYLATDIDPRTLSDLHVRAGSSWSGRDDSTQSFDQPWHRGAGVGQVNLPGTFGIIPDPSRTGDPVTLVIEDANGTPPSIARLATFRFVEGQTVVLAIALPQACLARVSDHCPAGLPSCTLSQSCYEQDMTCGNDGRCRPQSVDPSEFLPYVPDASSYPTGPAAPAPDAGGTGDAGDGAS